jgi:hypothetical protein
MAVQERFTPEEWQEVVAGPVDAGMLIAFTQPQGPLGLAVGWAAGEVPRTRAFSDGLPPNRAGPFSGTRLSRASARDALPRGTPRVDGDVAIVAGDQGLPLARSHLLDPGRNRPTAMTLEILQVAHVVDLHAVA